MKAETWGKGLLWNGDRKQKAEFFFDLHTSTSLKARSIKIRDVHKQEFLFRPISKPGWKRLFQSIKALA